jgi:uncharacterized membrane protein
MMWYDGFGPSPWMWLGALTTFFVWIGLAGLAVWAAAALLRGRRGSSEALDVLKRRLAAGEISEEQYERTRGLLER